MSGITFRSIRSNERDAVLDLLAEWYGDRDFFARYFRYDPSFRDELCFVACDGSKIVSTFQVFRKQVRSAAGVLQVAGVGNVFTTSAYRRRGIAFELLQHGLRELPRHGFHISLLFASRLEFYGSLGYRSHPRLLTLVTGATPTTRASNATLRPLNREDLPVIRSLYEEYSQPLYATTVRDETYWYGQMRYAGNPDETVLVAVEDGRIVAYARGIRLFDLYVVMEHAYAPGHTPAFVDLLIAHYSQRSQDTPGMLAHLEHESGVRAALEARGLASHRVEDASCMWRVIDPEGLTTTLGVDPLHLGDTHLWGRLFPPERSLYWIADRF